MFANVKIGTRLAMGFGALLLLICTVAGVGAYQASRMNDRAQDLAQNWLPSVRILGDLRAQANALRRASLRHVLETDAAGKEKQAQAHKELLEAKIPATFSVYQKLISSPEEAKLFERIKTLWSAYLEEDKRLIALSDAGAASFDAARQLSVGSSADTFAQVLKAIEEDVALNVAGSTASAESAAATYQSVLVVNVVAIIASLAVGIALGIVIARSVTRPIHQAVELTTAVASGDLTSHVDVQGDDETAQLLHALEAMQSNLGNVVASVRANSESVATASAQIAHGNHDLSQRTEEQASALQQTAATMEQLNTTVRSNADNAKQASQLAQGASAVATQGGEVVGQVVRTMQGISESSCKIGDIIGVIEGIAFQTNILALNAAVESARAGEQGRGFAVVASEVRILAQRSAEAAQQIKTLINQSIEQVEQGSVLVDQAGQTMGEIVTSIRRVTDIVGEISSASQEQSAGISQVGDAVSQMDHVTQQNAALVEESAAAAESLKGQAQQLVQAVAVFKLSGDERAHAPRSMPLAANAPTGERRGVDRAQNVSRPAFKGGRVGESTASIEVASKTGTDDWTSF